MQRTIQSALDAIEREHRVKILFACECGSRSWGTASPASDYDVRFIYVRPTADYLTVPLVTVRDVIEVPVTPELDINGWDLRKALKATWDSNPAVVEWVDSPVVYRNCGDFRAQFSDLVYRHFSPHVARYHYLSTAVRNNRKFDAAKALQLKKYIHIVRPLLACLWLEREVGRVPVAVSTLVEKMLPPGALRSEFEALLERKRQLPEIGEGEALPALEAFIASEIARGNAGVEGLSKGPTDPSEVDRFLAATLRQHFPLV